MKNAQGGLLCHQLKYVIADDGGNPSKNASLAQQLVERDKVVAFIQNNAALAYQGSVDYLVKNKIPVLGGSGAESVVYEHPNYFPQVTSGNAATEAVFGTASGQLTSGEKEHFGMLTCQEISICTWLSDNGQRLATKYGLKLVYAGRASITQPDYTSNCAAAKSAGVTAFLILMDGSSALRVARSCNSVQLHPRYVAAASATTADMATNPAFNGAALFSSTLPYMDTSNASITEMNAVLRRYAPGLRPDTTTVIGWTAAKIFEHAARSLPIKDKITSADILAAMGTVKNFDAGGLTYPLSYTTGKHSPIKVCWFAVGIKNGRFVALSTKVSCREP